MPNREPADASEHRQDRRVAAREEPPYGRDQHEQYKPGHGQHGPGRFGNRCHNHANRFVREGDTHGDVPQAVYGKRITYASDDLPADYVALGEDQFIAGK
jgi:hypothetical protein